MIAGKKNADNNPLHERLACRKNSTASSLQQDLAKHKPKVAKPKFQLNPNWTKLFHSFANIALFLSQKPNWLHLVLYLCNWWQRKETTHEKLKCVPFFLSFRCAWIPTFLDHDYFSAKLDHNTLHPLVCDCHCEPRVKTVLEERSTKDL